MTNAELKQYRSLDQKKFREKDRLYLVEGVRLCEELLHSSVPVKTMLCTEDFGVSDQRQQRLLQLVKSSRTACERLAKRQFDEISTTEHSQGVVAVAEYHDEAAGSVLQKASNASVVLLDRISDPGNLGTIVRTCAWFGVGAMFLGTESVDPYNPKVVRATMGGLFKVPFSIHVNLADIIPSLKKMGYTISTTHLTDAVPISKAAFTGKSAFLFGNEAEGVSDSLAAMADQRITIPGGNVESLSVGVAVGIVLAQANAHTKP